MLTWPTWWALGLRGSNPNRSPPFTTGGLQDQSLLGILDSIDIATIAVELLLGDELAGSNASDEGGEAGLKEHGGEGGDLDDDGDDPVHGKEGDELAVSSEVGKGGGGSDLGIEGGITVLEEGEEQPHTALNDDLLVAVVVEGEVGEGGGGLSAFGGAASHLDNHDVGQDLGEDGIHGGDGQQAEDGAAATVGVVIRGVDREEPAKVTERGIEEGEGLVEVGGAGGDGDNMA